MKAELQELLSAILSGTDRSMDKLEKRILSTVNVRMDNLEARLTPLERKVSTIEGIVIDMHEDLNAGLKAIDSHALLLIDHGKCIGRLEKRLA